MPDSGEAAGSPASKRKVRDLAINGGPPAFSDFVHVGRPNIGNTSVLLDRFRQVLESGWLTNGGPQVELLEKQLAHVLGGSQQLAVANGTLGLMIASRALDLKNEVIMPAFTFVATAHALQWQGLTPIFCDIDPETYLINPDEIESLITDRTSAILAVHLFGRPCDIPRLQEIATKHRIRLLFDSAHSVSCTLNGRLMGDYGDANVFSFHATKVFNTFEGGAISTNDPVVAERSRLMRNFGFSNYDTVDSIGLNAKLSEIAAAMGNVSLETLKDFIQANKQNYVAYRSLLADLHGIKIMQYDESESNNYQYVVVEVDETEAGVTRDRLVEILQAENVLARRYFTPGCHRVEPYVSQERWRMASLPETDRIARRLLVLPTGTAVTYDHIETITEIIRLATQHPKH